MDKHTTTLSRWNLHLLLLIFSFLLSACDEGRNSADMITEGNRISIEQIESNNEGNALSRQITPEGNGNAAFAELNQDDAPYIQVSQLSGPAWGVAARIGVDNAKAAIWPQIALDNSGNALVVWVQKAGASTNIWANRFNGADWGTAEQIETNNGDVFWPQVAFDNSGNALVVWAQDDGTRTNIQVNRFNGSSWGSAELIETDNAGDALWPQIAFDSNGNALAVWVQKNGVRYNIQANRFDGSNWGTAELIETDNTGDALWPQIALDGNGNALAVWAQDDGTRTNIRVNRFNGLSWGAAELIETDNAGDALWPQIAFDSNGNALAVWAQNDGVRYNIRANRFNGARWGSAEQIETDNAEDAFSPQIAIDSNGNALALWGQYDGTRTNIWANRFNGTGWGVAGLIETDNVGSAFGPQIAFDSSGKAFAVWVQKGGTRYNIRANRFDGSSWGRAELIETDNAGDAFRPQIVLDNSGNAIAVWEQYDGVRGNIRVNHFK